MVGRVQTGTPYPGCPRCADPALGRLAAAAAGHAPGSAPVAGASQPADGMVACPVCGHRAAAGYVNELGWLRQQDALLHARLDWVAAQVAEGAPPPARATAPGLGAGPGHGAGLGHGAGQGHGAAPGAAPGPRGLTVQTLLLVGGAVLLVVAAAVFAAVAWDRLGAAGQISLLVVAVAVLTAAAHVLRTRLPATAETLAGIAAGVALVALLAAPDLGLGGAWMREQPRWAAVCFGVVAGFAAVMASLSRLVVWRVTLVGAAVVAVLLAAVANGGSHPLSWAVVAGTGAAGAALLAATGLRPASPPASPPLTELPWLGGGLSALAVVLGLVGCLETGQRLGWLVCWVVLGACAAGVALAARRRERGGWEVAAAVVAGLGAGLVPALALTSEAVMDAVGRFAVTLLTAVLGAVALAVAARAGHAGSALRAGSAATCAAVWAGAPLLAGLTDAEADPDRLAVHFGVVGAALLLVAAWTGPAALGWAGAVAGSIAAWIALAHAGVETLEPYTLACAGLLLLAGGVTWWHHREIGSLVVLGPALAMALLPSALRSAGQAAADGELLRGLVVIAAGAVLAVVGAAVRIRAAVYVGLLAAVVAGLGQLAAVADAVPRWVVIGTAGALLVGAGFTFEAMRTAGRRFWHATSAMR